MGSRHDEAASSLIVEDRDAVRWVLFNRPEVHNAQNVEMLEAFDSTLDETSRNASIRVLVLGGVGRSFCSGHDLKQAAADPRYAANLDSAESRWRQEQRLFTEPIEKLRRLTIPTICRVQGYCLAAGLMFVGAADLVVAASDAVFGSRIVPSLDVDDAELPTLSQLIGIRRAKQFLWLGETFTAQKALEMGVVNWVVEPTAIDAQIETIAQQLCALSPEVIELSKSGFSFLEGRQGWSDYAAYHFLAHQLSHQTTRAKKRLQDRVQRVRDGGSPVDIR
jgi:enoyl-CoA hydratase/carnithine racemase